MQKGSDYPGVVATKVFDFKPFFQFMPTKMQLVVTDDDIT
jgi:hypothetical protein